MKNDFNRFLGNDEIADYIKEDFSGNLGQDDLEQIYNNYVNGNISDFKESFKSTSELAQFLVYMFESGVDPREILRAIKLVA